MKLFLLERTETIDYDEYDSCVVCAKNEEEAKEISIKELHEDTFSGWTDNKSVISATEIGTAKRGTKVGIILASFNAG